MSIMQFKNPLVANAHNLTSLSSKVDRVNQLFFLIDWVKPGRHHFTIQHDKGGKILDRNDFYEQRVSNFMQHRMIKGKKSNENFYVHDVLATFRDESLPVAYKQRHTTQVTRQMFKARDVFKDWQEDTAVIIKRTIEYDMKYMRISDVVDGDKKDTAGVVWHLTNNYSPIKEIYHYLQSKSSYYPNIDNSTLREQFFR